MRPRKSEIDEHKMFILNAYNGGETIQSILDHLCTRHDVECTKRTLQRRLRVWIGEDRGQATTQHSPELVRRVHELYFSYTITEKSLLTILQNEGFAVTRHGLAQLRFEHGLRRKNNDETAGYEIERVRAYIQSEKFSTNTVRSMGRRMLYTHLRTKGFNITQDRAWTLYSQYHQEEIDLRSSLARQRRHGWTVPGPNYTWSVDGYAKLAVYGFEVYAAVDAYSRYIPWFFIGHSAFTASSVVSQYLTVVGKTGIMPRIFRSDRGGETSLLARAHYFLSVASRRSVVPPQEANPTAPLRVRTILEELAQERARPAPVDQDQALLPFSLCWSYSKSIYNVKIERWWGELCSGRTEFWRTYFSRLASEEMFSDTNLADRIAILFIYMPRIRSDFIEFVHLWNAHHIRSQPNRPYVVHGVPLEMYKHPYLHTAQDFAVHPDTDRFRILADIFRLDEYDADAYLPVETMQVCSSFIAGIGGLPEVLTDAQRATPYINEYEKLRLYLADYMQSGQQPAIGLLPKPVDGAQVLRDLARRYSEHVTEEDSELDNHEDV